MGCVDSLRNPHYNPSMPRVSRLREEKRRVTRARDAALTPRRRLELGAAHVAAARAFFMAGMAARGFSPEEALRAWRRAG